MNPSEQQRQDESGGPAPLTAEERRLLGELAEAATPGPWTWSDKNGWSGIVTPSGEDLLLYAACTGNWHGRVTCDNPADMQYIVAACNAVPALLAQLDTAERAVIGAVERLADKLGLGEPDGHAALLVRLERAESLAAKAETWTAAVKRMLWRLLDRVKLDGDLYHQVRAVIDDDAGAALLADLERAEQRVKAAEERLSLSRSLGGAATLLLDLTIPDHVTWPEPHPPLLVLAAAARNQMERLKLVDAENARLRAALESYPDERVKPGARLSLREAQRRRLCRICGEKPGLPLVLNFGDEFACEACLRGKDGDK